MMRLYGGSFGSSTVTAENKPCRNFTIGKPRRCLKQPAAWNRPAARNLPTNCTTNSWNVFPTAKKQPTHRTNYDESNINYCLPAASRRSSHLHDDQQKISSDLADPHLDWLCYLSFFGWLKQPHLCTTGATKPWRRTCRRGTQRTNVGGKAQRNCLAIER